jgi:hypothetical protein
VREHRFFELVLLADQSLVQAGWLDAELVPERAAAAAVLAAGPAGRGATALPGVTLKWTFEPGLGLVTAYSDGRVALLGILLGGPPSPREEEMLAAWIGQLRAATLLSRLNGEDPEAFEIFRRLRDRPLAAAVLLPEGSRQDCQALVQFQRGVAAAFLTARWNR